MDVDNTVAVAEISVSSSLPPNQEFITILAELCRISYSVGTDAVYTNTYINTMESKYGFKFNTDKGFTPFTTGSKRKQKFLFGMMVFHRPTTDNKTILVIRGDNELQSSSETQVQRCTSMTAAVNSVSNAILDEVLGYVVGIMHDPRYANLIVTGHGIGGYIAEIVACIFDLSGVAFSGPGLKETDVTFIQAKNNRAPTKQFNCIASDQDGLITGFRDVRQRLPVVMFEDQTHRPFFDFHSLINMLKFFNRADLDKLTTENVAANKSLLQNAPLGRSRASGDVFLDKVFAQGDDLRMRGFTLALYVVDLTVANKAFIGGDAGLKLAVAGVMAQINGEFSNAWQVTVHLVNATPQYEANKRLFPAVPLTDDFIANDYTNFIVNSNIFGADWNHSGIVYLVDSVGKESEGYHLTAVAKSFDVPYGLVSVKNAAWTVSLSHEVMEILTNPWVMRYVHNTSTIYVPAQWDDQNWVIEVSDPCPQAGYTILVNTPDVRGEVIVSDFVVPEYFNTKTDPVQPLNYLGISRKGVALNRQSFAPFLTNKRRSGDFPFPLFKGGYLPCINIATNEESELKYGSLDKPFYSLPVTRLTCAK